MGGRLAGKVAIVTGAGSGLGQASALRFAAEGAAVACADVDKDAAAATAATAQEAGAQAVPVAVDVSSWTDCERMAAETVEAFGTIDVLFANAGIAGVGSAMDCTLDTWERTLAVNLTGVWLCSKAVLPTMVERRSGSIINTASVGGMVGVPGIAPYAAAKAGVIGLTRQAAVEFGPKGVRVNVICPGTVPTPLVTATYEARSDMAALARDPDEAMQRAVKRYALRRFGEPDDIANMALFLASDESKWTTGGVFVVDGGMTA